MSLRTSTFAVFALFVAIYILVSGGHLYSPDEEVMFRVTESIAKRGELSIEPLRDTDNTTFASRSGKQGGREYGQYGLGNSIAAIPFYWMGDLLTRIVPEARAKQILSFQTTSYGPDNGHDLLRRFAVSFFGAFVGAAICALLWRLIQTRLWRAGIEEHVSRRAAWIGTLAFGLGTMGMTHSRTFFSEPLATFWVLASLHAITGGSKLTFGRAVASGGLFALALVTRLDSLFVAPAVGLPLLLRAVASDEDLREVFRGGRVAQLSRKAAGNLLFLCLGLAVPFMIFGAYQLALNYAMFGSIVASGYSDQSEGIRFSTPVLAGLYGFLFSVGKSIFLFSPVLFLMFAGIRPLLMRAPVLAVGCMSVVIFALLVFSKWVNWSGGWDWGPRHVYIIHPFACVLIAGLALDWTRVKRVLCTVSIIAGFMVQLFGASQNPVDFYVLYYRTPFAQPNALALYSASDIMPRMTRLEMLTAQGWKPQQEWGLIAPMNDTVYVPQNSVWYRFAEMWQLGYRDNLWLRLLRRSSGAERPIQ